MHKIKANLLICLLVLAAGLTLLSTSAAERQDVEPCSLFANGTRLRHPEDCSQEILCIDFKSVPGTTCTGSKPFYDKDIHKCVTRLSDNSTCDIKCTDVAEKFVADPKSCYGYYFCQDDELALYNRCPERLHFNQTRQACIDVNQSNCEINKLDFCAIVSSGVKFKDQAHCGRYNECILNRKTKQLELKNVYCGSNAMYFNAAKGVCVAEPVDGCRPVPKNVCVVNKKIKKNYFVSDSATCRGSFYCADVGPYPDPNPQWIQCAANKFFSQQKQMCLDSKQVVCLNDRCNDGSNRKYVVSSERGCRHYLMCKNGVKVGEGTCGNDFFDEDRGMCTPQIITYPACYYK